MSRLKAISERKQKYWDENYLQIFFYFPLYTMSSRQNIIKEGKRKSSYLQTIVRRSFVVLSLVDATLIEKTAN